MGWPAPGFGWVSDGVASPKARHCSNLSSVSFNFLFSHYIPHPPLFTKLYRDVRIKEGDDDNEPGLPGLPNLHADQKEEVSAKEPEPLTADPLRELDSRSALHKAVCAGSVDEVSRELEGLQATEALKKVNQQDDAGYFPLHSAAAICLPEVDSFGFHEASEIVRMLLSAGANVAACDGDSNTALHWAARVGNDELTQSLLMNRCPVGKMSLFCIISCNNIEL